MSRRTFFGGSARGGGAIKTAGFSKGCYITPDLMLIEQETAARVAEKERKNLGWIFFRSKREAKGWIGLVQKERAGLIRNLRRQVKYLLHCPAHKAAGDLFDPPPVQVTSWTADYVFEEFDRNEWIEVVADAKGWPTDTYKLRRKWMLMEYGIEIREI